MAVKNTTCSRGPGFNSQHPQGSLQFPVTIPIGDPTTSHRQNINAHKIKISYFKILKKKHKIDPRHYI